MVALNLAVELMLAGKRFSSAGRYLKEKKERRKQCVLLSLLQVGN